MAKYYLDSYYCIKTVLDFKYLDKQKPAFF